MPPYDTSFGDDSGPKKLILPGLMNNLFSAGGTGVGYDYMEWTSNATPAAAMPTMIFPFACRLIQITCRYLGQTSFQCTGSDTWTVNVYKVPTGSACNLLSAVKTGPDLFEWNASLSGTFPSTSVTLPEPISISVGDEIVIVGTEKVAGTQLQLETAEAQLMLVFEYD